MNGICINKGGLILNEEIQKAILNKNLKLLIRDENDYNFYLLHKEQLKGSMTESEYFYSLSPELKLYEDEPISTIEKGKNKYKRYPNCIVGELTDNAFDKISNSITYTSYTKIWNVWLPFIGYIRIPLFWIDQLSTWKYIKEKYSNDFPIVWVKFGQRKELNEWAKQNNKDIFYYSEEEDIKILAEQINNIED